MAEARFRVNVDRFILEAEMNVNILMAAFLTSILRGHDCDKVNQSFHLVVIEAEQKTTNWLASHNIRKFGPEGRRFDLVHNLFTY